MVLPFPTKEELVLVLLRGALMVAALPRDHTTFPRNFSAELTETTATLEGVQLALDHGWRSIILEGGAGDAADERIRSAVDEMVRNIVDERMRMDTYRRYKLHGME
ncbi:hypothetical protein Salat_0656900 [Sesamum alatum]|uniref:RNase H type-1 domain-containing protein n=1 Tax=Sesamum alatum TaxID=300844 RepID=A0AAE1YQY5_9LAMI|nr:hypothetical protein Salat_0656900 [Sesamum alatum]